MKWHRAAQAAHLRQLGAPQPFPLVGDGDATRAATRRINRNDPMLGVRLAEARYRDWLSQRDRGTAKAVSL
jgi:hypothetical protein